MLKIVHWSIAVGLASLLALAALPLRAQPSYPSRPISMIVPLAAGSSADQVARLIGRRLSERWQQPVIVENRPGAGTITATIALSRAPRDGHTLMLAPSGTLAINPTLYKSLPYDPQDFVPIAHTTDVPLLLVTAPGSPYPSLMALVAAARAAPKTLVIASSGLGTANHLAAELLQQGTGAMLIHAPYRDTAAAMRDVAAGHVHLMFADAAGALGLIQAGKLRALAVSTSMPVAVAAGIPTLDSLGLAKFDAGSWHMLLGPRGLPRDIVVALNEAVAGILAEPEVRRQIEQGGLNVAGRESPEELLDFLNNEQQRWRTILQQLGLAGSQ